MIVGTELFVEKTNIKQDDSSRMLSLAFFFNNTLIGIMILGIFKYTH